MKIEKYLMYALLLFSFACKEEKKGPLFSGEVPDPVKNYTVENLPGASEITFELTDTRALYVKAVYTLKEGLTREAKSSKYDNRLVVDGFAESKEYTVTLYAVGEDEQESEPVQITVHPETPPFRTVLADMLVQPDYGGGNLSGSNDSKAKLMIGILRKDPETGEWIEVDSYFIESQSFNYSYRGLPPVETEFGIFTRDQWQNFSDTLVTSFVPWEESIIDLASNFRKIELPGDAKEDPAYTIRDMFDGVRTTWATGYYSLDDGTPFPKTITLDLGGVYQLSRFKYWQNNNLFYQSANAKHIRVWGSMDPNPDGSYDDSWYLLNEFDNWKPSGLPPGEESEEDLAQAQAGNEFVFPREVQAARYIRVEAVTTWQPRSRVYYPELEFWGRSVEE